MPDHGRGCVARRIQTQAACSAKAGEIPKYIETNGKKSEFFPLLSMYVEVSWPSRISKSFAGRWFANLPRTQIGQFTQAIFANLLEQDGYFVSLARGVARPAGMRTPRTVRARYLGPSAFAPKKSHDATLITSCTCLPRHGSQPTRHLSRRSTARPC